MEKTRNKRSGVKYIVNVLIWVGIVGYFAHNFGLLEKSLPNGVIRVTAGALEKTIDILGHSSNTLSLQVYVGNLYHEIGEDDNAFIVLQSAIPLIEKLDNVHQRAYSSAYFLLGEIRSKNEAYTEAQNFIVRGLRLEPQNLYYQMYLGDLYRKDGKKALARTHYNELLEIPSLWPEAEALIKIGLLNSGAEAPSNIEERNKLSKISYLKYPMLMLVPLNDLSTKISLEDICIVLEPIFRMGCFVQNPLILNAEASRGRSNQLDADKIVTALEIDYPRTGGAVVIGVTSEDIYAGESRFVFSLQRLATGHAIVSAHRFFQDDTYLFDNEPIYNRRITIQLVSTIGQLLGFPKPVKPHCPLAYPNGLGEFLLKRETLCPPTTVLLKELLARVATQDGVILSTFSKIKIDEIIRVRRKYGFDG